jgi:hypothetical protein
MSIGEFILLFSLIGLFHSLSNVSRRSCFLAVSHFLPRCFWKVSTPRDWESRFIFVSAFWRLPNSDRPYHDWMASFFHVFTGELYFYTCPVFVENIIIGRPQVHLRYNYATPWDIPCIRPLRQAYHNQTTIDPEPGLHRPPEVFAIWNGKICLVREVSLEHPRAVVFWIDAGSLREPQFANIQFPSEARMHEVLPDNTTQGKMIFTFFRVRHYLRVFPIQLYDGEHVGAIGGFFGGDFTAIEHFYDGFWSLHDHLMSRGAFVGVDQAIFTTFLVYANETWVQANWETGWCDPWFATWSFWSDPGICFSGRPVLHSSREFVDPGSGDGSKDVVCRPAAPAVLSGVCRRETRGLAR